MVNPRYGSRPAGDWWLTGILILVGFALLFWAEDQLETINQIAGSLFRFPRGRLLVWLGILVLAGAVFGLAVATTQTRVSRTRGALLIWTLIPLAVMTYFYLFITGFSMPPLGPRMTFFITARVTVGTSAILVGLFISAAIGPLVLPSGRRH